MQIKDLSVIYRVSLPIIIGASVLPLFSWILPTLKLDLFQRIWSKIHWVP